METDVAPTSTSYAALGADWIPVDTFGARLALVRQQLGLNVTQAAKACGLSQASWHTWERGVTPRNVHVVARAVHRATGASFEWLVLGGPLSGEDEMPDLRASGTRWSPIGAIQPSLFEPFDDGPNGPPEVPQESPLDLARPCRTVDDRPLAA